MATQKMDDPVAYPGVSDAIIAKFPPTLFVSGIRAFDLSTAVVSHTQFVRLGVDAQLYAMEASWHGCFFVGCHSTPEAKDTVTYIARWFDRKLAH